MSFLVGVVIFTLGFVVGICLERIALLSNLATEGYYLSEDKTKELGQGRYSIVTDANEEITERSDV